MATKDERHKTDLRIPKELYGIIEGIAKDKLGISVNAFFTMAASHYTAMVLPDLQTKKRREVLKSLEREFQKMVEKALQAA
jgi:hypothetical protein